MEIVMKLRKSWTKGLYGDGKGEGECEGDHYKGSFRLNGLGIQRPHGSRLQNLSIQLHFGYTKITILIMRMLLLPHSIRGK